MGSAVMESLFMRAICSTGLHVYHHSTSHTLLYSDLCYNENYERHTYETEEPHSC